MTEISASHLPAVKQLYEDFLYPARDPADEKKRLIPTWLDDLPKLNHYCYAGRQTFLNQFRILIAGGGSGDASIYLGEQLRRTSADIQHLDLRQTSIAIARERAAFRGLTNIRFIQDSILNLPKLGLGIFDSVNCSGIRHHLANPDAGLQALRTVLKDDGAIGAMLYGTVGRTGVYPMQMQMRMINDQPESGSDCAFQAAPKPTSARETISNTTEIRNALDRILRRHRSIQPVL